ncbi:Eukaryotic translation initiation factor 2 subunit beta, variant 2 [Stylosanthes scabra]|uniref:Eukaryotic translation initiation factor 2 subunit beta, variant 2 n=1 Tax=Stylosanthes scabra TaxID=79078 RepID=A0ABU6VKF5_9FABA|nr:Eukaryotic translation initiation factor 2 subunit beta, variant 2 [Stylosanthes scabra]
MADEPLNDTNEEVPKLHSRVFNILLENNPELAGDRRGTVLRPPQVLHEDTKKTVFPEPNQGLAGLRDFFSSCCSPPKGRFLRVTHLSVSFDKFLPLSISEMFGYGRLANNSFSSIFFFFIASTTNPYSIHSLLFLIVLLLPNRVGSIDNQTML